MHEDVITNIPKNELIYNTFLHDACLIFRGAFLLISRVYPVTISSFHSFQNTVKLALMKFFKKKEVER